MTVEEAKRELKHLRMVQDDDETARIRIRRLGQPYREVLIYRYECAMSWKQVADKMEYSTDHLRGYMNKKAIEKYAGADQ